MNKKPISQDEFDQALFRVVAKYAGCDTAAIGNLLQIDGIYEILSEEFNNDAIDEANRRRKR
jgi:hypothetical protein